MTDFEFARTGPHADLNSVAVLCSSTSRTSFSRIVANHVHHIIDLDKDPLVAVMNNELPSHSSAIEEKLERHRSHPSAWTRPLLLPIPGVRTRRLRILVPNAGPFNPLYAARLRRRRGPLLVGLACIAVFFTVILMSKSFGGSDWTEQYSSTGEPPTLVFKREDLQRIWKWEVASGHYPSHDPSELQCTSLVRSAVD